jgi:hypothetical protein
VDGRVSGDVPGKRPAGKIGKDLECGVINLDVMDQKFSLLKKLGCGYAALLIVYIVYMGDTHRTARCCRQYSSSTSPLFDQ